MRFIIFTILAAAALLAAFPAEAVDVVISPENKPYIVVKQAPPVDVIEETPSHPGKDYAWIKGRWKWENKWVWYKGHWMKKPHPDAEWIQGHWNKKKHGWVWIDGHWE